MAIILAAADREGNASTESKPEGEVKMTSIKLIVNGAQARAEVDGILTSGSVGIPVSIQYDSTWDGLSKDLVCTSGKWGPTGKPRTVLNAGTLATIAHEVMIADRNLYIGVEGRSSDGNLVVRTVWADCGTIFPGANANADPSAKPTMPIWAQLQAQIDQLKNNCAGSSQGGLTDTLKSALVNYYTHVMPIFDDANGMDYVNAVLTALGAETRDENQGTGGGDTSGDNNPPEDTTDPIIAYSVTNNLTNVTTDNDAESVTGGKMYTANLTAEEGYTIESVVVTMGGVEISAYGDGVISIDSVTGDIVITATATQMDTGAPVYQLASEQVFDGTAEYDTGYALWGGANEDFTICLDFTDAATPKSTYPMYIIGQVFTAAYLWLTKTYNGGAFNARYNSGGNTAIGIANNVGHGKIVVTHVAGETGITVHTASGNYPLASSSNYPTNDPATIKLGANGFTGTVHDFKVYDRVLVTDEINTYLGVGS